MTEPSRGMALTVMGSIARTMRAEFGGMGCLGMNKGKKRSSSWRKSRASEF
jgi:hypothetical protein